MNCVGKEIFFQIQICGDGVQDIIVQCVKSGIEFVDYCFLFCDFFGYYIWCYVFFIGMFGGQVVIDMLEFFEIDMLCIFGDFFVKGCVIVCVVVVFDEIFYFGFFGQGKEFCGNFIGVIDQVLVQVMV